ncbi:hypothetical protein CLPU_3c01920 [Gottschalkia purinilytica]|uniref:Radical SAM core domain-containing protein n=1 Tax=Gottschalkia purinilytica TaxID=1503 RepID=A0A0L0WD59_GOTPU|nr:radical SAM/SPASM domain Clo7bot peptide maturase [Gottschalkia purinilytica]KNF09414.1 hypothetical protein CLPU_3c01920 [Gottschalkia purinilytica]
MKKSRYNHIWDLENGKKIAFNSLSCGLAEIDNEFLEVLENIDKIDYDKLEGQEKELIDNMLLGNFIIQDYVDEFKLIKFRHYQGKFSTNSLGLTIAPTLNCNFKCPYCYETPNTHMMDETIKEAIIRYVKQMSKSINQLQITWYGGEPIIAKDIIFDLSEKLIKICEENNCTYGAFIVTNGYLLNDEIISKLKEYKIHGAQVTLDGPPTIHNKRRILKNGENTFDKILENIKKLKEQSIRVSIRINIDKENESYVEELLDILKDNGLNDLDISLGHVTDYTDACKSISGSCLSNEEYANLSLEYQKILHNKNFAANSYPYYPGIKANYCCADQINSFVIDSKGYMYKCWNNVGDTTKSVGNITELDKNIDKIMMSNNIDWMTTTPFEYQECIDCDILPICMGGCPYNLKREGTPQCEKWRYNLDEILKYTYEYKESEENLEEGSLCGI